MKKQNADQKKPMTWVICLIIVVAITAVRLICHFAGVEMSDTLSRVFGGAEIVAVAAMVYFYMKWRQQQ